MAPNISEDTNVKTPLAFLLKVFGGTIFVVYSAMLIYARLNTLEMEILRLKHEVEMNSDFRYTWPREGELPADVRSHQIISLDHSGPLKIVSISSCVYSVLPSRKNG